MNWLEMISRLFNWLLRKRSVPVSPPVTPSIVPPVVPPVTLPEPVLPHPQEAPDFTATLAGVSIAGTLAKWLKDWQVPGRYWDYWRGEGIIVTVRENISYPAQAYEGEDGKRHLDVQPAWLNPGVIAHENAHNSWALLTDEQKTEFSAVYTPLKSSDPLIVFLYQHNTYGLVSDIEGHAELYRYLAQAMPKALGQYYPGLI